MPTVIKHKTLSTYYARLTTLEGYCGVPLTRPGDDSDYRAFVSGTICASHDRGGDKISLVKAFSSRQDGILVASAHHDCIDWVMADLRGRGKNVLIKPDTVSLLSTETGSEADISTSLGAKAVSDRQDRAMTVYCMKQSGEFFGPGEMRRDTRSLADDQDRRPSVPSRHHTHVVVQARREQHILAAHRSAAV